MPIRSNRTAAHTPGNFFSHQEKKKKKRNGDRVGKRIGGRKETEVWGRTQIEGHIVGGRQVKVMERGQTLWQKTSPTNYFSTSASTAGFARKQHIQGSNCLHPTNPNLHPNSAVTRAPA